MKYNKSSILTATDELLNAIIREGSKDLKTTFFIYEFLANLICTNKVIARKVVNETRLFESFKQLLETCTRWNSDLLETIFLMIQKLVNRE